MSTGRIPFWPLTMRATYLTSHFFSTLNFLCNLKILWKEKWSSVLFSWPLMREKVDEKIKTSFDRRGIVHFTYNKLPQPRHPRFWVSPNCYQDWLHVFVCLRFQSLAANNYIHTRTLLSQKVIFTLSLNDSFSFSTAMTSTSARRSCPASRSTGRTGDIKVGLVWAGQWAGQGGVSGDTLSEARLAPASSLSSLSVLRDRDYFVQIPWVKVVPGYWVG